jgi:gluconate 5-dehydrogenase
MTQALSAGLLSPSIMGPPIVWLASPDAAGVHDERIVATEFQEPGVRAQAARGR